MIKFTEGGGWIAKRKLGLGATSLIVGWCFTGYLISNLAKPIEAGDVASVLTAFMTLTVTILGATFAADVTDKRLNGGRYDG